MPRDITTIKLTKQTKLRLDNLRSHHRDSYEEILQRMLEILNTCINDPEKAREKLIVLRKLKIRQLRKEKIKEEKKKIILHQQK